MKPLIAIALGIAGTALAAEPFPKIIAHRGASFDAPENTLSAFNLAWEQGADGIETDIYLTADGKIVCIHDPTTKRTGSADLKVTASNYADLSKLDFGSWKNPKFKDERIPTLEVVMDGLPAGKFFFVEIKDTPRIVEPLAQILATKKADPKRVILISFSSDVVKACRETIPDFQAYLITSLKDFEKPGKQEAEIAALEESGAQGLLFKTTAPVTAEWLKAARGNGRKLFGWNVDEPVLGRKMLAFGIDFFGSNRPGFIRAELTK